MRFIQETGLRMLNYSCKFANMFKLLNSVKDRRLKLELAFATSSKKTIHNLNS